MDGWVRRSESRNWVLARKGSNHGLETLWACSIVAFHAGSKYVSEVYKGRSDSFK